MSWSSEDGLHECYVVPEFADGQCGLGTTGGGIPDDQIIVGVDYEGQRPAYVLRPAGEVVGWRAMCDCRNETSGHLLPECERWQGELLKRVTAEHLEDISAGKVFAADEDVAYVGDRDDVADAAHAAWADQHVRPREALIEVARAREGLASAVEALNRAMSDAQDAGVDADAVIRAAGLPRMPRDFSGSDRSIDGLPLPLRPTHGRNVVDLHQSRSRRP
jgi:hypothetical protein